MCLATLAGIGKANDIEGDQGCGSMTLSQNLRRGGNRERREKNFRVE